MKTICILLLSTLFLFPYGNAQGLIFDTLNYHNLEEYNPEKDQGYAGSYLPSKLSYRAYCPPVQNQGQFSTCVGWATAYAQLSTQQNIMMGETNFRNKQARSMDPNFIYAMIKSYSDNWCQQGTMISDAMEVLLNFGVKPYISVPWLNCNSVSKINKFSLALAEMYSVQSYYVLDKSSLTQSIKQTLNNGKVISVGMQLTPSFDNIGYSGHWKPNSTERIIGKHALCIVGYDDNKNGGSFEIMNSYGTSFGENGFVWITYNDMKLYLKEAYVVELAGGSNGFRKGNCSYGDCNNYYSRYKYDNGNIYEGEFTNGYRHGWGSYLETDGTLYIGSFTNGYHDGWGILYDTSSGYYYKTFFQMGSLDSYSVYQGFSGGEEDLKMDEIIKAMQSIIPGDVVSPKDDAYEDLMERFTLIEEEQVERE